MINFTEWMKLRESQEKQLEKAKLIKLKPVITNHDVNISYPCKKSKK